MSETLTGLPYILFFQNTRFFGVMPAYAKAGGCLGAKLVSFYATQVSADVSSHHAIIALFDPATGAPLAVSDRII